MTYSKINVQGFSADELWELYGDLVQQLNAIGELRSKNITGEWGEHKAVSFFNNNKDLPNLELLDINMKHADAIDHSTKNTYSIKTISNNNRETSRFYGLGTPENPINKKLFDYLIIVEIDNFKLKNIFEISWEDFFIHKKWVPLQNAYSIRLTKKVLSITRKLF